jgi:hypothetical protein
MQWSHITKSVLAFLGLLATNIATELMQHDTAWPTNGGEWARWVLTIVLGTLGVYSLPNTTKEPEVAATQSVRLKKSAPRKRAHPHPDAA